MNPTATITRNGQKVECYGKWEEDSNAMCIFLNPALDGPWADGAKNWEEVVETLTAYAKEEGTVLIELQAL